MTIVKIFDQTVPYVSGYSMRSRYIAASLAELGAQVRAFSSPIFDYESAEETIDDVEYCRTPQTRWNRRLGFPIVREFSILGSLRRTLRRHWSRDVSLIHAHSSLLNGWAALRTARKFGVPCLYESRAFWEDAAVDQGRTNESSLRYRLTRSAETRLFRESDHVTVICEGMKRDVIERGIDPDQITVIPNGVDLQKFRPVQRNDELAERLGLNGRHVVGFIGTFFRFEGLHLLIEAAREVAAGRSDVRFLIVGGGDEDERLRRMTTEHNLDDVITFTGRVPHDEVRDYYSVIDVLVYPRISKRITELVTPLKPLEAMALRKVVIGSDVGGISELVDDNRTGLLFRAGSVPALVEQIHFAIDNPTRMTRIADNAREHVERERNWREISRRYLSLYDRLGLSV